MTLPKTLMEPVRVSDGGPFHPVPMSNWGGITLRDWLAAMVLQGDWSCQNEKAGYIRDKTPQAVFEERARVCYRMADAMIAESTKGKS